MTDQPANLPARLPAPPAPLPGYNGPRTDAERWKYAETLAEANLVPKAYRGRPADVFYAVEYARTLDLPPLVALTSVHVIDGTPTASADLMDALIRRAGHRLRRWEEGTLADGTLKAVCTIERHDDPGHVVRAEWDLDRAHRAELIDNIAVDQRGRTVIRARSREGKATAWEKFTEAMLAARALSECARRAATDALLGVKYVPEELESERGRDVDEDGNPLVVEGTVVEPRREQPTPPAPPADTPPAPATVPAADTPPARPAPAPQYVETGRRQFVPGWDGAAAAAAPPAPPADSATAATAATAPASLTANLALNIALDAEDADRVRALYKEARDAGLLRANVRDLLVEAELEALELPTAPLAEVELGRVLIAAGRFVGARGQAVASVNGPGPTQGDEAATASTALADTRDDELNLLGESRPEDGPGDAMLGA